MLETHRDIRDEWDILEGTTAAIIGGFFAVKAEDLK
jgi:hypothetical protein